MKMEWITPEAIVVTLEEVAELANLDLACASAVPAQGWFDHL